MTFRWASTFPWARATAAGVGAGVIAAVLVAAPAAAAPVPPGDLVDAVSADSVLEHLTEFQAIADANGGNRAVGTPGYEASGVYIESVLEEAGYEPRRQEFVALTQELLAYDLTITGAADVPVVGLPMEGTTGTGPEPIEAELVAPTDPLACATDAWTGVDVAGKIAVVSRGDCTFTEKVLAASEAGAIGILVYNNEPGDVAGSLGEQVPEYIPAVGLSDVEGAAVLAAIAEGPVTASLLLDELTTETETFNIIADTPTGRTDNTVMLGAHLDSVPEGAGINDNGSGSAAILDVAVQLADAGELNNQVRFAWWGAEEVGLLGSYHYVDDLATNDPGELEEIATYLNFDMVGSPNYVMSVYDANESSFEAPVEVPEGSIATESVFTDYFDSIDQPWIDTAFDGRSDYDGFIAYGIPASGIFTGADDIKTVEEAEVFGGVVGEQHDQNYHSPGDDIGNIDEGILDVSVKAIAFATASLANDTSAVNGIAAPVEPTEPPVVEPEPSGPPVAEPEPPAEEPEPTEPPVVAPETPETPETPEAPETPETPETPAAPPAPLAPAEIPTPEATPTAESTVAAVVPSPTSTRSPRALAQSGVDGGTAWTMGASAAVIGALGIVLVLSSRAGRRGRADT
jgi:Zn-dependent M28 family amino/carboxypeptidase